MPSHTPKELKKRKEEEKAAAKATKRVPVKRKMTREMPSRRVRS